MWLYKKLSDIISGTDKNDKNQGFQIKKSFVFFAINLIVFYLYTPQFFADLQTLFLKEYTEINFFNSYFYLATMIIISFNYIFVIPIYIQGNLKLKEVYKGVIVSFYRNQQNFSLIFGFAIFVEALLIFIDSFFSNLFKSFSFTSFIIEFCLTSVIICVELELRIQLIKSVMEKFDIVENRE